MATQLGSNTRPMPISQRGVQEQFDWIVGQIRSLLFRRPVVDDTPNAHDIEYILGEIGRPTYDEFTEAGATFVPTEAEYDAWNDNRENFERSINAQSSIENRFTFLVLALETMQGSPYFGDNHFKTLAQLNDLLVKVGAMGADVQHARGLMKLGIAAPITAPPPKPANPLDALAKLLAAKVVADGYDPNDNGDDNA